jgi:hypothetical protein
MFSKSKYFFLLIGWNSQKTSRATLLLSVSTYIGVLYNVHVYIGMRVEERC